MCSFFPVNKYLLDKKLFFSGHIALISMFDDSDLNGDDARFLFDEVMEDPDTHRDALSIIWKIPHPKKYPHPTVHVLSGSMTTFVR